MFLIVIFFPEMMPNIFFLISHDQLMPNFFFFFKYSHDWPNKWRYKWTLQYLSTMTSVFLHIMQFCLSWDESILYHKHINNFPAKFNWDTHKINQIIFFFFQVYKIVIKQSLASKIASFVVAWIISRQNTSFIPLITIMLFLPFPPKKYDLNIISIKLQQKARYSD